MRKWKQISAFCLAAALTVSGPAATVWAGSPEFARTPEEWAKLRDNVMEYDELAGLIREYNVTVQKNQLDINDKKKDDRITSDQNAQYYRDAANDYRNMITGDDPVSDASGAASANRAEVMADNNVEDLQVYQLTYEQEEANLVATAQSSMITYFQQRYELETAKSSLEFLEAAYQSALVKQSAGMATQTDVLGALESVQSTQASIDKLTSSVEETRQKLCVMLGWKYNDTPDILEIPAVNMERIAAMNPDTDKESALGNSYTLKINKRKLENAVGDITKQTLNRTISNNEQNIGSDLTKRYRAVLQAKAAYDQAGAELALESKNMDTAQRKYDLGALSKLDYLKQKNAYDTKNLAIKTAELALFQAVQNYDNALNGLASAGGL
ncbi:TolC family protein [Lacrimispora sphenoides]|uniref:Outer membrane efflux protein n=1 Tax=Lacrimispora sphenoides JCM 1415 TaxID=1297793 RepID=A0ABY1CID8_9FIRM|nr:TolC family protein [Lacrimispora sphenoides]SEU06787.1 Outer membrane efflux protein [[Clostridium] sphenoides JCM 1415]SUY49164.1 Outer membrane efflux protein [Lacrimispora sphenoides]